MKRLSIAQLMDSVGLSEGLLRARRSAPGHWLTVLTYHRVSESVGGTDCGSSDVVDANPRSFERQIAYVAEHCSFVGIDDLERHARGEGLRPNPVFITFDDGYRECHDVALPILRRYGARATFFIATSNLAERRLFWWDRIAYAVTRSRVEALTLDYPARMRVPLDGDRFAASRALFHVVKTRPGLDVDRFCEAVSEAACVTMSRGEELRLADELLMTWEQVRALDAAGMGVESHTRTHRVLQTLSPRDLGPELGGAREELEGHLRKPVSAIAYPVGYPVMNDATIVRSLKNAGYRWGFTNQTGVSQCLMPLERFDVARIAMSIEYDGPLFQATLALPQLAYTRRA